MYTNRIDTCGKPIGEVDAGNHPASVLSELLECPTDEEIGEAARGFHDEQGNVPTAFAFQAGARWAREIRNGHSNDKVSRALGIGWSDLLCGF